MRCLSQSQISGCAPTFSYLGTPLAIKEGYWDQKKKKKNWRQAVFGLHHRNVLIWGCWEIIAPMFIGDWYWARLIYGTWNPSRMFQGQDLWFWKSSLIFAFFLLLCYLSLFAGGALRPCDSKHSPYLSDLVSLEVPLHCSPQRGRGKPHLGFLNPLASPVVLLLTANLCSSGRGVLPPKIFLWCSFKKKKILCIYFIGV